MQIFSATRLSSKGVLENVKAGCQSLNQAGSLDSMKALVCGSAVTLFSVQVSLVLMFSWEQDSELRQSISAPL